MDGGSNTRVVLIFPGALGDLVLAMPTFAALRARHAGADVTLALSGWLEALAATSGVADAVASLDAADAAGLFGGDRMPPWMRDRPRVYAWIGGRDPAVRQRLCALASHADVAGVVRDDGSEHAAVAYASGVGLDVPAPFAWPLPPATPRIERLLARLPGPVLAVHAGAGSTAKRWAREGFRDVVARWSAAGGAVVEIVGPAERDLAAVAAERLVDWSLPEICALLGRIDAYVGSDSGVTHLAAAAGASGVAVYGPTPARRWAPYGGRVAPIQADGAGDGIDVAAVPAERIWRALGSSPTHGGAAHVDPTPTSRP